MSTPHSSASSSTTERGLTGIQTVVPTVVPTPPGASNTRTDDGASLDVRLGLGLGIPFLILLIMTFVYCIYRRQRRRQRKDRQYPPHDFNTPEGKPVSVSDFPQPPPPRPPRPDDVDVEIAAAAMARAGDKGVIVHTAARGKVPDKNSSHTSQLPHTRWSWRRHRANGEEKERPKEKERRSTRAGLLTGEKRRSLKRQRREEGWRPRERPTQPAVAYQAPSGPPVVPVSMLAPGTSEGPRKPGQRRGSREQQQQQQQEKGGPPASLSNWPLPGAKMVDQDLRKSTRESDRRVSKYFSPQHLYRQWETHQQREREQRRPANLTVNTQGQDRVGMDEVSPLSSSGSATYPHRGRISAVSGMGQQILY